MPCYAWVMVLYLVLDRLLTVAVVNRMEIKITPGYAVMSLITGALMVWGITSLAS